MGTNFLVEAVVVGNGGNGFKLKENRFKLEFFLQKKSIVLKHCNRLSRGVIDEQTDLVEDVSVRCRVGWTRWPLNIPFQPKFYHPMTFLYPTLHI